MNNQLSLSEIPCDLSVDELLEVKGGLGDNNKICSLFGCAVRCTVAGSGICTVAGSGIIITTPTGPDTDTGGGNQDPTPDPGDNGNGNGNG